jgi:5-methylcytosine-specific restriction endonuclease McrA
MAHPDKILRDARIFKRDDFTCQYCGYEADTFEKWRYLVVDHFKARSRGGLEGDDNLKTACMDCNFMKSNIEFANLEEARQKIKEWIEMERKDYGNFFSE